ncbi:MAG TPA: glycosyltransferase family 39 protein [Patescibacteria group bacterium]
MEKIVKKIKPIHILIAILALAFILRFWNITKVPVSLFGDEVDLGYQAYSFLKTGKDYSGNILPLHFNSLAEWRTPLYLYSAVPTVALFGISPYGVRLPAVIFGVLGIWAFYLLVKELFKSEKLALLSALVLTFSPWHFQYSRAGFEVTELLFFLMLGLYFFFKGLKNGKWMWLAAVCFCLTPWIYSTAKLFTPFLIVFLTLVWRKEIFSLPRRQLVYTAIAGLIVGVPIAFSTMFGGGTARFDYIGIFTDPTIESEVGFARQRDALMRGETQIGVNPTIIDRLLHNKFTIIGTVITRNYFQALGADYLFNTGDPNSRHSIQEIGQFYKLEAIPLVAGLFLFFVKTKNKRLKALIGFWILAGVLPSALTRDGGTHSTRLILILPPLVILISYGIVEGIKLVKKNYRKYLVLVYGAVWVVSIIFFLHGYFVHNPWDNERMWHYGFKEAISAMKEVEGNYSKVIISTYSEPPWIFFAGFYPYPPAKWHEGYPFKKTEVKGFGNVSYIDKYYFGTASVAGEGVYGFGKLLDKNTLYVATANEVKVDLIHEPERTPGDLKLIKAIAYPSGAPAFYIFSGR